MDNYLDVLSEAAYISLHLLEGLDRLHEIIYIGKV